MDRFETIGTEEIIKVGGKSFKRHRRIKSNGKIYTDRGWVPSKIEAEQIASFLRANNNEVIIVPSVTGESGHGTKVFSIYAHYKGKEI